MRRRKLSVGWCIRLYYSDRNCKYSLYFVHIHAYANTNSRESVGKFNTFFQIFYFSGKYFTLKFSIRFCNFSKMRGQKYFFDFRFEISVKFRVGWCIRLYDSFRICLYSPYFVYIHAYANTNLRKSVGKFDMNHIVLHIIRREIWRWFRIWSQNFIFAHAF